MTARPGCLRVAAPVAALWLGGTACHTRPDTAAVLAQVELALDGGDFTRAEQVLRQALERSPDDGALLLATARLYQGGRAGGPVKARLSLHYALRASTSMGAPREEAEALVCQAFRLSGQVEEARVACAGQEPGATGGPAGASPVPAPGGGDATGSATR